MIETIRRKFSKKIAEELTSVQPMPEEPMLAIFKFFENNPGIGFYFGIKENGE